MDNNKYYTNKYIDEHLKNKDKKNLIRDISNICYTVSCLNGNLEKALLYIKDNGVDLYQDFDEKYPFVYKEGKNIYANEDLGEAIFYLEENFCQERLDDIKKLRECLREMHKKEDEERKQKENIVKKTTGTSPNVQSRQTKKSSKKTTENKSLSAEKILTIAVIAVVVIFIAAKVLGTIIK